ncbi:MAG: hypothetical protein JNK48_03565 [Bryobacterales bacterium]|nr:hypothetical protein [Bryobacterales bacterium]
MKTGKIPPAADSIAGAGVLSVPTGTARVPHTRLVDIDPDRQTQSMIVGLCLPIHIPSESGIAIASGDSLTTTIASRADACLTLLPGPTATMT